ncbi:MAG: hypothetical protein LBH81_01385 [Rickettsiales bacterium]|jgi:hypothetical protein|nr:hypothetical protein [Rickettsiales bacterium]
MISQCSVCGVSYDVKKPKSQSVRCVACGNVWTAGGREASAAKKFIIALALFLLLVFASAAAFWYMEESGAPEPMRVAMESARMGAGCITVDGRVLNQTDSLRRVPKIAAVVSGADGTSERILFTVPSPQLLGGESVEFSEKIEYNVQNPKTIRLELSDED